jgi:hypothetical protein
VANRDYKGVLAGLTVVSLVSALAAAGDVLPPLPAMKAAWDANIQASIPAKSYLPPGVFAQKPKRADAAQQQPLRPRPATDRPSVAKTWGDGGDPADRPTLAPATAPALVASPDPARVSGPWRETSPDQAKPDKTTDPAQDQVLQALLAVRPERREKPAAFLRLAIPDPLELQEPLRLQKPPPDDDPPVAAADRPPKPVLQTRRAGE